MPWGFASLSTPHNWVSMCYLQAERCPGAVHDEPSRTSQTFLSSDFLIISGGLFPFPVHGKLKPRTAGLVGWQRWVEKVLTSCSVPLFIVILKTTIVWLSVTLEEREKECVCAHMCKNILKSNILVRGVEAPGAHNFWAIIWRVTCQQEGEKLQPFPDFRKHLGVVYTVVDL